MEQKSDNQVPTGRIYKRDAILIGTYLGGPLAAGYLIAENFKTFNETGKAKKTWIYAIISTILIVSSVFLIPDNVKFSNFYIRVITTGITYYLVQHFQGQYISVHENSGGQSHNWWMTPLVIIIAVAITAGLIFLGETPFGQTALKMLPF